MDANNAPDDRKTLAALEALRSASRAGTPARPRRADGASPAKSPPASSVSAAAAAQPSESRLHCLGCGYPLMSAGGYRCSECGRTHSDSELVRWYAGGEMERFERVIWLVRLALFLRVWALPMYVGITTFSTSIGALLTLSCVAQGWAAFFAGRRRFLAPCGYAAVAVLHLMGISVAVGVGYVLRGETWVGGSLPERTLVALDIAAAALLAIALVHKSTGLTLPAARRAVRLAYGLLLALPIGALLYTSGLFSVVVESWTSTLFSIWRVEQLVLFFAPFIVWLLVWRQLVAVRRTLFGRPPR